MQPMLVMPGREGLTDGARVVVEKPFGTDPDSARELDATLNDVVDEEGGAEHSGRAVRQRPHRTAWHRNHLVSVQIDIPEELTIEGRGSSYESTGCFRDMISRICVRCWVRRDGAPVQREGRRRSPRSLSTMTPHTRLPPLIRVMESGDRYPYRSNVPGVRGSMIVKRLAVMMGLVALLVGVVGLLTPVSVSPERQVLDCGSALAPDLSAAEALDDGNAANIPTDGGLIVDVDYTELCRAQLHDRRVWTVSLGVAGLGVIAVVALLGVRSRRGDRQNR